MPLCPQITNTPITVTLTADFTVTSVIPVLAANTEQLAVTDAAAAAALATANTALANAATAFTAAQNSLQPSANTIVNASNQITAIASNGITVFSGSSATSGARVVLNSAGLAGFDSGGSPTFSVSASSGAAVFSGSITGSTITGGTLNIGGNAVIDSSGFLTATGATITGTITSTSGRIGGWFLSSTTLASTTSGTSAGFYIDTSGAASFALINATGFQMNSSGAITMGSGTITGASTISASTLQASSSTSTAALSVTGAMTYPGIATASGSTLVVVSTGSRIGFVSSSRKTKSNISALTAGSYLDKITAMVPVSFDWKNQPEDMPYRRNFGLIAEDTYLIPEINSVVNLNEDGEAITISYDRITPFLVMAIKELQIKLNALGV